MPNNKTKKSGKRESREGNIVMKCMKISTWKSRSTRLRTKRTWKRSQLRIPGSYSSADTLLHWYSYIKYFEYSHVCVVPPSTKKKKKKATIKNYLQDYLLLSTKSKEDTCVVIPYNWKSYNQSLGGISQFSSLTH